MSEVAESTSGTNRGYRYLTFISSLFVVTLIVSNIIAVKLVGFWGLYLPAAVIVFPLSYIMGDVLAEVYGYAKAREVIWIGFFGNLAAVVFIWLAGRAQAAPFWNAGVYETPQEAQKAFQAILGFTPRLLAASFVAYLAGELMNAFVLVKLKLKTKGRHLWLRTIGSTVVGQGVDSFIFITTAFVGTIPLGRLPLMVITQWLFKVGYETLATPLTYVVVNRLKRAEGIDHFDVATDFRPVPIFIGRGSRVRQAEGTTK